MGSIEIWLNGEKKEVPAGLTVADLVRDLGLVPERLAIEYNVQILKRANWHKQLLSGGDKIEMVHFVGGGS